MRIIVAAQTIFVTIRHSLSVMVDHDFVDGITVVYVCVLNSNRGIPRQT